METGKNRWQTIKNNWGDLIESALNTPRENPKVRLEWEKAFQVE